MKNGIKPLGEENASQVVFYSGKLFASLMDDASKGVITRSSNKFTFQGRISHLAKRDFEEFFLPCQGEVSVKNWLTERLKYVNALLTLKHYVFDYLKYSQTLR